MKKLKIESLALQSFVTKLTGKRDSAKGGRLAAHSDVENCSALDACESALQCIGG